MSAPVEPDFTRQQVADICRKYGPSLQNLPNGVDGTILLWALSGNESSFGWNCTPRHEMAYDVGGRYASKDLLDKFGSAAACSYGPWQVMFVNAPPGYYPDWFKDLDNCAVAAVYYLNGMLKAQRPPTLGDIGDAYNSGTWRDAHRPEQYIQTLELNYKLAMPPAQEV
jgi:hypothetical protein